MELFTALGRPHWVARTLILVATLLLLALSGCTSADVIAQPVAPAPQPVPEPAPQLSPLQRALRSRMDRYAAHGFSGAVLVARGDEVLLARGYGQARLGAAHEPWSVDTPLDVASIAKTMTAALVLMLVEEGRMRLDDSIGRYVPELPPRIANATIAQLLGHTGGLSSDLSRYHDVGTPGELLERLLEHRMADLPGDRFLYTNAGYALLAAAIDEAAAMPFEQLRDERIFQPLQLKLAQAPQGRTVTGLLGPPTALRPAGLPSWNLRGGGSVRASVREVWHWGRTVTRGKLLPKEALERMFAPGLGGYGLGWHVEREHHGTVVFHGGTLPAVESHLSCHLDHEWCVAIASDSRRGWLRVVLPALEEALQDAHAEPRKNETKGKARDEAEERVVLPSATQRWSRPLLAALPGVYPTREGQLDICRRDDALFVSARGDAFALLVEPQKQQASTGQARLAKQSRTLLTALGNGTSLDGLLADGMPPKRLAKDHRRWLAEMVDRPGGRARLRVFGTLDKDGAPHSYIALDGPLGTNFRTLRWSPEDKLVEMDPSAPLERAVKLTAIADGAAEYLLMLTGDVVRLQPQLVGDKVTAIELQLPEGAKPRSVTLSRDATRPPHCGS